MKRIELNKKIGKKTRVRVSRTGGASISTQPVKGLTLNTKHGLRVAKSYKGLQLALQGKSFRVRGRYQSKGGTALNVSKSGFSISQKVPFGTLNLTNPKRSSVNIGGLNLRGKNALPFVMIGLAMQILAVLLPIVWAILKVLWWCIEYVLRIAYALVAYLWTLGVSYVRKDHRLGKNRL